MQWLTVIWQSSNGRLLSFPSYQDYLDFREQMNETIPKIQQTQMRRSPTGTNKETQRELKRKQRNLDQIEADIYSRNRKNELLQFLNDFEVQTDYKKSMEYGQELAKWKIN